MGFRQRSGNAAAPGVFEFYRPPHAAAPPPARPRTATPPRRCRPSGAGHAAGPRGPASSSSAPALPPSCPASTTAPPSVLRAASTSAGPAGPSARHRPWRCGRWPRRCCRGCAMPSAPPNSELVSEMAEATPARSGGALPTTRSVASVNTGAKPERGDDRAAHHPGQPVLRGQHGQHAETQRRHRQPAAHHEGRAHAPRQCRRDHRADDEGAGARHAPQARIATATGRAPAAGTGRCTGRCRTSRSRPACRTPSETLKAGRLNSRRSIIGSASRFCRRTNSAPSTSPSTIDSTGIALMPVLGDLLDTVDHRQHRAQRQRRAGQVERGRVGIAVLGQQQGPEHQQQHHHRHADQEHRAPRQNCSSTPPSSGPMAAPAE